MRSLVLPWAGGEELLDDLLVVVSELSTNAVVHAGTAFEVSCAQVGAAIRVAVQDGYPGRGLPAVLPAPDPERSSGRGLALCAALSAAWGVEYTPTSKTVWCLLAPADAPQVALPVQMVQPARPELQLAPAPPEEIPDKAEWAEFSDADLVRLRFDDMLQRAVQRACDAFAADAAYLRVTAEPGTSPGDDWLATTGLSRAVTGPEPTPPPGRSDVPAAAARSAGPLPAVYSEPAVALPVLAGTGMQSAAVAPLLADGRAIGELAVASRRPQAYGPDDARRLQQGADRLALSVQARRLAESTRRQRDWLGYLAEASDLLSGTLEPQMTIAMLAQLVVPRLATWCAVRLYDERGAPGLEYTWHADETLNDPLRRLLDAVPAGRLERERPPVTVGALLGDAPAALRSDHAVSLDLHARGRRLGVAVLGRRAGVPFEQDALALAEELARRAALALDNALLYRTHRATSEALQRSLLPAALPEVPGLDVGVAYQAAGAGLDVGGDFYDLFTASDGLARFSIGDVAGNGPEAAGVTGLARNALRLLGRQQAGLAAAVTQLNTAVLEQGNGRFLTLVHGEISPRPTGGMRMDLVVAGHPSPYLLRPTGQLDQVGSPQPLLGVLADVTYRTDTVLLERGESLVCLTDGVTERRRDDGRILGESELPGLLSRCAGLSAGAIAAAVSRAVADYTPAPPRDDMAVLVMRVS